MTKEREAHGIILYPDYEKKFEMLPDEEKASLIMAMFAYNRTGAVPDGLTQLVQFALSFICDDMDHNREKYEETCKRNRENGKKGGRPRKQEETDVPKENPVGSVGYLENPENPNKKCNYNENDNDNKKESESDKEKENISSPAAGAPPHTTEAEIPSLEAVRAFCRQIQSTVDLDTFYHYYAASGWTANGRPITDWQAKLRYWDQKDREKGKTTHPNNTKGAEEVDEYFKVLFPELGGEKL